MEIGKERDGFEKSGQFRGIGINKEEGRRKRRRPL
jgi:hypothetical protein